MNEQEQILRENIRQLIRHVKQKKLLQRVAISLLLAFHL